MNPPSIKSAGNATRSAIGKIHKRLNYLKEHASESVIIIVFSLRQSASLEMHS